MKVLGINGSARKDGNTALMLRAVFAELEKAGIETEMVQLAGTTLRGCTACYACFKNKDLRCANGNDALNQILEKMLAADGILLGSPTYFTDVTAEMKALIDRAGMVLIANGSPLRHKAAGAVIAVRRGGATHAFDTINHFLHYQQMFLVGASYWNMGFGRNIGEVEEDEEGMRNMRVLGQNMAFLLEKLHATPEQKEE